MILKIRCTRIISNSYKNFICFLLAIVIVLASVNIFSIKSEAKVDKVPSIIYSSHIQGFGWAAASKDGEISGTTGMGRRIEAITLGVKLNGARMSNGKPLTGGIKYAVHVQGIGWMNYKNIKASNSPALVSNGNYVGTVGQARRVEALRIELTGDLAKEYDVLYCGHIQGIGWTNWNKNGAILGTVGQSKRVEAFKVKLVKKKTQVSASISYRVHSQSYGWMNPISVKPGVTSAIGGTVGKSKRLEAISLDINTYGTNGWLMFSTHVQSKGWTNPVTSGKISGSTGEGKRMEAIKINLMGDISAYYDIYYRVHVQNYGWLDWAKNGQPAGTENGGLRMEAIQVALVAKDGAAPGPTTRPYIKIKPKEWYDYPGELSIKINKQENCVTVYKGSKAVKAFICSTGEATPEGTHYISNKWRWQALMGGVYGQYCSQICGDILFHSVPYNSMNIYDLSVYMYNQLGTQASHGCVRLTVRDAKWIYDNCPMGTPVTVYNSPDPGPLGKPTAEKLTYDHTWDPTDPAIK